MATLLWVHRDEWGELYRADMPNEEPLVMVRVINSTPEPDGSFRKHWLRVPPTMHRAREAVAWTFQKAEQDYAPAVET